VPRALRFQTPQLVAMVGKYLQEVCEQTRWCKMKPGTNLVLGGNRKTGLRVLLLASSQTASSDHLSLRRESHSTLRRMLRGRSWPTE
jgi:hypothetical protein